MTRQSYSLLLFNVVSGFLYPEYTFNTAINDFGLKDIKKAGVGYCAIQCAKRRNCKTVEYQKSLLTCKLHNLSLKEANTAKRLVVRNGTLLTEISTWRSEVRFIIL